MGEYLHDYRFWCIVVVPVALPIVVLLLGLVFGIYPSGVTK